MRNREAENNQTNQELQGDSPSYRSPRNLTSITGEQPGDACEDHEAHH
jgi:hypothetical protein